MLNCNPCNIPAEAGTMLSKDDSPQNEEEEKEMENVPYRSAVGSLMYAAICTRPDIAVAVNQVARFCENPGPKHWAVVKQIMRYLKGTMEIGLTFDFESMESLELVGHSDSTYGDDIDTRQSTSGYSFFLNKSLLSWASRKQDTVTLSTTEAEYVAICESAKEAMFLRQIFQEIGFSVNTTKIYGDNSASIDIGHGRGSQKKMKHYIIRWHYVRERVANKDIEIIHMPGAENPADALTKCLAAPKFRLHNSVLLGQPVITSRVGEAKYIRRTQSESQSGKRKRTDE